MARVVVVDDDESIRVSVRAALQGEGCEVLDAGDGASGLEAVRVSDPDLIILDLGLPDMDGFDFLRALQKDGQGSGRPVILFSARDDVSAKVKSLELGAVEYLVKPVHPRELVARVRAFLRFAQTQEDLRRQYLQAVELSLVDEITRVYNRRYMERALRAKVALSLRHGYTFSCAMFDVDHFKRINDTHGHAFGDFVLKEVASLAVSLVRKEDAVIRYGGDEFVVLLAQAGRYGARQFAERLLKRVRDYPFDNGTYRADITINIGLSTFPEDAGAASAEGLLRDADGQLKDRANLDPLCARLADDLLQKADARMYAAKGKGEHGVVAE